MATIPDYLKGADTTLITLTPQTKTGSTLADTTPVVTSTNVFENFKIDTDTEMDVARPATSTRRHNVPIMDGYSFEIDQLLIVGAEPDPLLAQVLASRYVKAIFTRGGKSVTVYGVNEGGSFGTQGQGIQRSGVRFACVDTGSSNFIAYA